VPFVARQTKITPWTGATMNTASSQGSLAFVLLLWGAASAISQGAAPVAEAPTAPLTANPVPATVQILELRASASGQPINGIDKDKHPIRSQIGLNDKLWVVLTQPLPLSPDQYALYLNGTEIQGLDPATDGSYQDNSGTWVHALVYTFQRNKNNDPFWKQLLRSPADLHVPVTIALGERPAQGKSTEPTIRGVTLESSSFQFEVFSAWRLAGAVFAILVVVSLVWGHARSRTTLRDNLLPQIEPSRQTYSLGRWQMAFWFTLIFAAFVFLFILLWDTNTVTTQALALMGISGATALASVAVDVAKDSPADAANRGLRALGLNSYADVLRLNQEIAARHAELTAVPPPADLRRKQLQSEIQDRRNVLRTYNDNIQPYLTQGWFKDITTDLNGTAIHRLQIVCWTVALGVVFVIGVYNTLAMPEFNANLLVLMGISSAGYVGFKYPEVNN
jgi:hypothetical protein